MAISTGEFGTTLEPTDSHLYGHLFKDYINFKFCYNMNTYPLYHVSSDMFINFMILDDEKTSEINIERSENDPPTVNGCQEANVPYLKVGKMNN